MTTAAASYPSRWRAPSIFGSPGRRLAFWALVAAYLVWSLSTLNVDTARILAGLPRAWTILARMVPPDFGRWELLLTGMVESVQIAIAATIIGACSTGGTTANQGAKRVMITTTTRLW